MMTVLKQRLIMFSQSIARVLLLKISYESSLRGSPSSVFLMPSLSVSIEGIFFILSCDVSINIADQRKDHPATCSLSFYVFCAETLYRVHYFTSDVQKNIALTAASRYNQNFGANIVHPFWEVNSLIIREAHCQSTIPTLQCAPSL